MSRRKNIQTLRGMNNEPRSVFAYRSGEWAHLNAEELVPGDIISVARLSVKDEVVPCDCLLLSGSAIVNEAALTGESIPQLKEQVAPDEQTKTLALDMKSANKLNILFGGTRMLQHTGRASDASIESAAIPNAPDNGCICYVLRTGFASSQVCTNCICFLNQIDFLNSVNE